MDFLPLESAWWRLSWAICLSDEFHRMRRRMQLIHHEMLSSFHFIFLLESHPWNVAQRNALFLTDGDVPTWFIEWKIFIFLWEKDEEFSAEQRNMQKSLMHFETCRSYANDNSWNIEKLLHFSPLFSLFHSISSSSIRLCETSDMFNEW